MTAFYGKAKQAFFNKDIDLLDDTIKVLLVTSDYVVDIDVHEFLDDIDGGFRVGTPEEIVDKTTTLGVFNGSTVTFTALTGDDVAAVVIYQDTGDEATSRLITYDNTAANLPYTPTGVDTPLVWDSGSNKIFAF